MTSIAWDGNGPVFKNGAVGTEQACCCGQNCCKCCKCLGGTDPVLNGTVSVNAVRFSGWNGTAYQNASVTITSGVCCCCDMATELLSAQGEEQIVRYESFFGALPDRTTNNGEPYDVAYSATLNCADVWEFSNLPDPCANYPTPCDDTWCVTVQGECPPDSCTRGSGGFKSLAACNEFP